MLYRLQAISSRRAGAEWSAAPGCPQPSPREPGRGAQPSLPRTASHPLVSVPDTGGSGWERPEVRPGAVFCIKRQRLSGGAGGGEGHRVGGGGAAGTGERSDAVGTGVRPGGLRSPGALGELGGGSTPRFPRPPSPIGHPHGPSQTSARCG